MGMRIQIEVGIAAALFLAIPSWAADTGPTTPNCFIRITSHAIAAKATTVPKMQFGTHLSSREECRALARIHQANAQANAALDPTVQKKVTYKWSKAPKAQAQRNSAKVSATPG
jgi:predicted LPLAT superfamily acyltransferase